MLGTVDRQGSLLGMDSLLARLFEGDDSSFYARMAADGDELISDEDFADCYSAGMGRPSDHYEPGPHSRNSGVARTLVTIS